MEHNIHNAPTKALRGLERLKSPAALPYMDMGAVTGYCGSISRIGDNADWDWCLYQDKKGEYVIFEVDGAGCVYNFTQHRFPTSEEPTFRFYVDNSDTPVLELSQSQFWNLSLGGVYDGPESGGAGPIWVVRNFRPMPFTKHFKITSSLELKGGLKKEGEGGWGHVTYTLYDTPRDITPYTDNEDISDLEYAVSHVGEDPKYNEQNELHKTGKHTICAGGRQELVCRSGRGSVAAIKLSLSGENAVAATLGDLRLRMYWDGHTKADVDAPIGTFFGNEYGQTDCDHKLLMLGMKYVQGSSLEAYNYFPMPFWSNAKIELYNKGEKAITVDSVEIHFTPDSVVNYQQGEAGYFTSSKYYEKTDNVPSRNSLIATVDGTGLMVYGVLTGYNIENAGCEGDVRVFFDDRHSPEIQSDGSESWSSYGWGFVTPPQCNPFSAYNGKPDVNSDWSEVRLTVGDSYFFNHRIRFELEHGNTNDGGGAHSGQIFCYVLDGDARGVLTDSIDMADENALKSHQYTAGKYESAVLNASYANGLQYVMTDKTVHKAFSDKVSFELDVLPENNGILIKRTSSQEKGRQAATVSIDGATVEERIWYYGDYNPHCCWLDDYFLVPSKYTKGKKRITVTLAPMSFEGAEVTWNHASFEVYSLK